MFLIPRAPVSWSLCKLGSWGQDSGCPRGHFLGPGVLSYDFPFCQLMKSWSHPPFPTSVGVGGNVRVWWVCLCVYQGTCEDTGGVMARGC